MRKVEISVDIEKQAPQLIQAFVNPDMLKAWWGVERSFIDKKKGGVYIVTWRISPTGFGYVCSGVIGEYDPGGLLAIENFMYLNPEKPILGPMKLTVRARPGNGSSTLTIIQDGYGTGDDWDWYYEAVRDAWPIVANTLKNYLESLP